MHLFFSHSFPSVLFNGLGMIIRVSYLFVVLYFLHSLRSSVPSRSVFCMVILAFSFASSLGGWLLWQPLSIERRGRSCVVPCR